MERVMTVTIRYFAMLRQTAGRDHEVITLDDPDPSPSQLYDAAAARHGISLDRSIVRAAINGRYVSWDSPISDGDEVVFIPPVSGG
jgi:molybdopterin converting factor subunit 1